MADFLYIAISLFVILVSSLIFRQEKLNLKKVAGCVIGFAGVACISAVAYSIWGILLKYNPVSKVAIFGFTNPVFGVLLSAWWLREGSKELGINALIALVLVCIGISIVNTNKAAEK